MSASTSILFILYVKPISSLLILRQQDHRSGCLLKRFVLLLRLILDVKLMDDVKTRKQNSQESSKKTTKPQNEQTNKEKTSQVLTEVSPSIAFPEFLLAPYWNSNAAVVAHVIAQHDLEANRIARLELTLVNIVYFLEVEKGPWERGWRPLYALTLAHKGQLRTVPTIVIAHTFCASPDTRISYRQCLLMPGYFCAV